MAAVTDTVDLESLRLASGEGRHFDLNVKIEPFEFSEESYPVQPEAAAVKLDISRTTGQGYALRLRFTASLVGACMRCLEPAQPEFEVDAREVSQPGGVEELESPYVEGGVLDLAGWARDALALTLPAAITCTPDCAGLCPACGANLNTVGPDHHHEQAPDPRWAKLSELHFE